MAPNHWKFLSYYLGGTLRFQAMEVMGYEDTCRDFKRKSFRKPLLWIIFFLISANTILFKSQVKMKVNVFNQQIFVNLLNFMQNAKQ